MTIPNLQGKNMLVVEDDDMSFLYLNQLLLLTRCTFIRARNGQEALEMFLADDTFQLVLMDIQLPDTDGKEVTREIRKHNKLIPVIAQTASRSTDELDSILGAGCTTYITKPFSMEDLFDLLEKYSR